MSLNIVRPMLWTIVALSTEVFRISMAISCSSSVRKSSCRHFVQRNFDVPSAPKDSTMSASMLFYPCECHLPLGLRYYRRSPWCHQYIEWDRAILVRSHHAAQAIVFIRGNLAAVDYPTNGLSKGMYRIIKLRRTSAFSPLSCIFCAASWNRRAWNVRHGEMPAPNCRLSDFGEYLLNDDELMKERTDKVMRNSAPLA